MAIVISEIRVKQVTDVLTRFSSDFRPFVDSHTAEDLLSLFDDNIHWYDHGFHICRIGHTAILGLHESFLRCNQPFKAEIKGIYPTAEGGVLEQLWHGTCANDIVRPDGTVVMKGSGKDFHTHVCMVVRVSSEGKITRIDEYDHRYWDEGKVETDYFKMTGPSLKDAARP